jgi:glycerophosphoryl diester phosphodiesterase
MFLLTRPMVIAHRGAAIAAPENTIIACERAVQDGADALELDLHLTADGHVVVIHDETVDRTTSGTGAVGALPLAELQALDAGHAFEDADGTHPFRGKGIRIPTLDEVIDAFPAVRLSLDLKGRTGELLERVLQVLRERNALDRSCLAAKDRAFTRRARDAGVATHASHPEIARLLVFMSVGLGCCVRGLSTIFTVPEFHEGRRVVTPRLIRYLERRGVPVHVWTVNDSGDMERLLSMGVTGLITDDPATARALVDARSGAS